MRYSKKTIVIGTVAATVGLAAIAGPVLAANIVSHDDQREQQHEAFEKSLAEKLGVPQADVDKALKEIQGDRLGKRIDAWLMRFSTNCPWLRTTFPKGLSHFLYGAYLDPNDPWACTVQFGKIASKHVYANCL